MIYRRARDDVTMAEMLAQYDGGPAVFYQRAATADDIHWQSDIQYPRIDYTLDMQENPARNTSGTLVFNVWCDVQDSYEPEDVELKLRELFHAVFVRADDSVYCFAWVRSDAFEAKNEGEISPRTYGVTVMFDVYACPCQYTLYPDPVKAMNEWTKRILPASVVIGLDDFDGWLEPTRNEPVVYWRLTSLQKGKQSFTHTWMNVSMEGHVYCREASDRLYNLVRLNSAHALAGHIPMEDTSPLFLPNFSCKPHMNYISQGQIQCGGHFGLLQPPSHYQNKPTGDILQRAYFS